MTKIVLTVLLLLCGAGAARAQTQPAPPVAAPFMPLPVTEARNAAVGYALTQSAFVTGMANACFDFPERGVQDPKAAYAGWRQRNAPYEEAAQGWVLYVARLIRDRQGPEAAQSFRQKTLDDFQASGKAVVTSMLRRGEATVVVCDRWMGLLADPRLDLAASAEHGANLREILAFHREVLDASRTRLSPMQRQLQDAVAASNRGDFQAEREILLPLAEAGHAEALGRIGNLYAFGKGVEKNLAEARSYWLRAADKGLPTAMYSLGSLYAAGQGGLPEDATQAAAWYRKAAEHRDERAMMQMSALYTSGRGVERNQVHAVAWASLAASNAHSESAREAYARRAGELAQGMSADALAQVRTLMQQLAGVIDAKLAQAAAP